MRARWYVGHVAGKLRGVAFKSKTEPTQETHGHIYGAVTGPFRTKRAAVWGCQYGAHWSTIAEAERSAKADAIAG